ncbi:SpoIIAA family protein [Aneurinibacillus sp. REN35]|uniref:STAS/SEC14 domain-containing protein n=1 Tax=Aneurinibacillus sp. REN35 TaxID=3237286 RepID=UPI003529B5DC
MLLIHPSREESTVVVEFSGTATQDDAQRLDRHVKERFSEDEAFNILAIIQDIDGSTVKGMTSGIKFDAKRWKQFNKIAVVSEKKWLDTLTELSSYLPGIDSRHFEKDQLDEAWNWLVQ